MGALKDNRQNPKSCASAAIPDSQLNLARDLDGYVHTPAGFLPAEAYRKVRAENPSAGLPAYEEIPLLSRDSPL